ncbi:MAG: hypothetical protein ACE5FI_19670, partial [Anaerolineales bacterium]
NFTWNDQIQRTLRYTGHHPVKTQLHHMWAVQPDFLWGALPDHYNIVIRQFVLCFVRRVFIRQVNGDISAGSVMYNCFDTLITIRVQSMRADNDLFRVASDLVEDAATAIDDWRAGLGMAVLYTSAANKWASLAFPLFASSI